MTPSATLASAELARLVANGDQNDTREALIALPVGMHEDVAPEVYHARVQGFASKGAFDKIERAPAVYKAWADGLDRAETPALRFGKALHMAALEPARFDQTYVIAPDFGDCRKTDNKKRRDEWRLAHDRAVQLDAKEGEATFGMIRSILSHPIARLLLEGGVPELTVRWSDRRTGLPAKARPDFYRRDLGTVVDVKTTEDASPDAFRRSVARYRYAVQDSFYRRGVEECNAPADHFVFVAVEKTPPYLVAVYQLDDDAVRRGRDAWMRNIDTLAECCASGVFPGYPPTITTLSLPTWAA